MLVGKLIRLISLSPALTVVISGCKKEEDEQPLFTQVPSHLTITLIEDQSVAGLVHVNSTSNNTNFYTVIFSENGQTTSEQNTSGDVSYQYTTEGTHEVVVRAHATQSDYIEESAFISISFGTTGNNDNPPTTGYSSPISYPGYTLIWSDEFNGNSLNTSDWNYEIGGHGWGNNELQFHRSENVSVGDGVLTIEAKNEFYNGSNYTSSRITTQGKQGFQYGRIDIRAALPYGQGLWPALWMLGDNFSSVGWPGCGEIDIMELTGGTVSGGDNTIHGTAHWLDSGGHASYGGSNSLPANTFADEFHVFSIIWDDQKIEWYRDDVKYHTLSTTSGNLSEFHQSFFFIFNVAVGGNWPGSPNASTVFPQKMFVDYVRVFQ